VRSLLLVNRPHLALKPRPVRRVRRIRRKKLLLPKSALINSELTAAYCVRSLEVQESRLTLNIGAGPLLGLAPFPFWLYAASRRCNPPAVIARIPQESANSALSTYFLL
jgi:hypothetical protein